MCPLSGKPLPDLLVEIGCRKILALPVVSPCITMCSMQTRRPYSCSDDTRHGGGGSGRSHSRHRGRGARKERVLHTRISEQLAEDIRLFADDLRVPASNLVRNVLEEVFTMVDSVSDDMGGLMDDLIDEAEGVRDRVRDQARSRSRGRTGRSRSRSSRRRRGTEGDVEAEFRRDEAAAATDHSARHAGREAEEASPADDESSGIAREAQKLPRTADLFPEILGWQPLVLNRDFDCGRCERKLTAGESAFLGIAASGLTETAICGKCASNSAAS